LGKADIQELKRLFCIVEQPATPPSTATSLNGCYDNITHDPRSEFKKYFRDANELIREKDWIRATRALQAILDHKDNFSVEVTTTDPKTKREIIRRVNARFEANRLIGELPAEGLDTYQTNYGGKAEELLEEAIKTSDIKGIAFVGLHYLHTKAGAKANDLVATYFLDRDDFWAASVGYKRLLKLAKRKERPVVLEKLTLFKAALAFRPRS